jgi:hypothetical protein
MAQPDRRSNARVPFIAHAEIIEEGSSVSVAVRVSNLGNDGRSVDMRAPLPKGGPRSESRLSLQETPSKRRPGWHMWIRA